MLIFVYGTLMKGFSLHHVLGECKFVGKTLVQDHYMVSHLDMFPVAVEGEGYIKGEVYEIDDLHLDVIDRLEGHSMDSSTQSLYERKIVYTEFGEVMMYYSINPPKIDKKIYDWSLYQQTMK